MRKSFKYALAFSAFGLALCGVNVESAHATFTLFCRNQIKATWTGAPYGRVDNITRTMVRYTYVDPSDTLICGQPSPTPTNDILTAFVQLSPGAIPALCGGKVQLAMQGGVGGTVPPFGGYVFDTPKLTASPSYSQATGRCYLSISIGGLGLGVNLNKKCKKSAINGWNCPDGTRMAAAPVDEQNQRIAKILLNSPDLATVLAQYDAFATPQPAAPEQQLLALGRTFGEDT